MRCPGVSSSTLQHRQGTTHGLTDEPASIWHGPHCGVICGVEPNADWGLGHRLVTLSLELVLL